MSFRRTYIMPAHTLTHRLHISRKFSSLFSKTSTSFFFFFFGGCQIVHNDRTFEHLSQQTKAINIADLVPFVMGILLRFCTGKKMIHWISFQYTFHTDLGMFLCFWRNWFQSSSVLLDITFSTEKIFLVA